MKYFRKKELNTVLVFLFLSVILIFNKNAKEYAYLGLSLWFKQMIPALFPFMVLTSVMVYTGIDRQIIRPFKPLFKKLFFLSDGGIYAMLMGFLCGFPMGAKCISLEYEHERITKEEAQFLLTFCNNIGPMYYLSFVHTEILPNFPVWKGFLCLYGLPFLYGVVMQYTFYYKKWKRISSSEVNKKGTGNNTLFEALDLSITTSLAQITELGGYMIICNLFVLFPMLLLPRQEGLLSLLHGLTEISGGLVHLITSIGNEKQLIRTCVVCLCFTGISCHMQTYHIIRQTGLSIKKYMLHKCILCSIACFLLFFLV